MEDNERNVPDAEEVEAHKLTPGPNEAGRNEFGIDDDAGDEPDVEAHRHEFGITEAGRNEFGITEAGRNEFGITEF